MNWVGGSRNRVLMKSNAKKQKDFFEKKRMQQRLKTLGVALPASAAAENGGGSMDLETLFVVNQIAAKKTNKDPPKIAVGGSIKGEIGRKRNEPLVLPMSPCAPSQLNLLEFSYSGKGSNERKYAFPQAFKSHQLSPVLESTFSDNSASNYLPYKNDTPFSSTSSSSSSQGFLKINLQPESQSQIQMLPHYSPPAWDSSAHQQTPFQLFSEPSDLTDSIPWSCTSDPTPHKVARVLFPSPESEISQAQDTFSLNQPEEEENMLGFMHNHSESKEPFEEDSLFKKTHMKIHLPDKTPPTCAEDDHQCVDMKARFSDNSFSCFEGNTEPMGDSDYLTSFLCERGYLSSESDDEEESCQSCLQAASSYTNKACLKNSMENRPWPATHEGVFLEKNCENRYQQIKCSKDDFSSFHKSDLCKCGSSPIETKDIGTQTERSPAAEACNASTQCSLDANTGPISPGLHYLPSTEVSEQPLATRWQDSTVREMNRIVASSVNVERDESRLKQTNRFLDGLNDKDVTDASTEERGQHEIKDLLKVTPMSTTIKPSETETLREIADILLLMKQWKK